MRTPNVLLRIARVDMQVLTYAHMGALNTREVAMTVDREEIRAAIALGMLFEGTGNATQIESGINEATERVAQIMERQVRVIK